ncbi:hypothetical protein ACFLYH_02605 [Candidatus Dependentiae bacterium]
MKTNKIIATLLALTICFLFTIKKIPANQLNNQVEQMTCWLDNINKNIGNKNTKMVFKSIGIMSKHGIQISLLELVQLNKISDSLQNIITLLQTEIASNLFINYIKKQRNYDQSQIKNIESKVKLIKKNLNLELVNINQIPSSKLKTMNNIINQNIDCLNSYLDFLPKNMHDQLIDKTLQSFANLTDAELSTLETFLNGITVTAIKNAINSNPNLIDQIKTDITNTLSQDTKDKLKITDDLFSMISSTL